MFANLFGNAQVGAEIRVVTVGIEGVDVVRLKPQQREGRIIRQGNENPEADCTVTCARLQLLALMNGDTDIIEKMQVEGDATVLTRMVKYITPIIHNFNIIEP